MGAGARLNGYIVAWLHGGGRITAGSIRSKESHAETWWPSRAVISKRPVAWRLRVHSTVRDGYIRSADRDVGGPSAGGMLLQVPRWQRGGQGVDLTLHVACFGLGFAERQALADAWPGVAGGGQPRIA
jgi:hypothetical protein